MKARIETDACAGCGLCSELCPAVFAMGSDDKAAVLVNPVPSELEADCRNASDQCPTSAIVLEG